MKDSQVSSRRGKKDLKFMETISLNQNEKRNSLGWFCELVTRVGAWLAWVVVCSPLVPCCKTPLGTALGKGSPTLRWTEGDGSRECWGEVSRGLARQPVCGDLSPKPALSFSASPELFVDGGKAGGGRKGEDPLE